MSSVKNRLVKFKAELLGRKGMRNHCYYQIIDLVFANDLESLREAKKLLEINVGCSYDDVDEDEEEHIDINLAMAYRDYDLNSMYIRRSLIFIKEDLWIELYNNLICHIDYKEAFN